MGARGRLRVRVRVRVRARMRVRIRVRVGMPGICVRWVTMSSLGRVVVSLGQVRVAEAARPLECAEMAHRLRKGWSLRTKRKST